MILSPTAQRLQTVVRCWVLFFIVALVLSGVTAFALETELRWLIDHWPFSSNGPLYAWVLKAFLAIRDTNSRYPFMAYGYDWLAFGHIVIALFFTGVLRHPVQNKWVLGIGMVACIGVFPLAFIAGGVRGIPVSWRLIDCSFGVIGIVPLLICYYKIGQLEEAMRESDPLPLHPGIV